MRFSKNGRSIQSAERKFPPLPYKAIAGNSFTYPRGQNLLCIFVMRGFVYGELVLSAGSKGPRKLLELCKGSTLGGISHDDLVGRGSDYVETTGGRTYRRPTLEEYVVLMKRIAAPTYPKDAQTMVSMLDLAGGSRVVEAGAGSGGMTLHLSKNGINKNISAWEPDLMLVIGWVA